MRWSQHDDAWRLQTQGSFDNAGRLQGILKIDGDTHLGELGLLLFLSLALGRGKRRGRAVLDNVVLKEGKRRSHFLDVVSNDERVGFLFQCGLIHNGVEPS